MKRYLRNCTALLLAVVSLLWLGGKVYKQTTTYRNLERTEETEKYQDIPKQVNFAVFGPSHGRDAFQAKDYGEGFFNFSMSSQTPQYDLMQLKEFGGCIIPGATVVLTVSYLSPFWTDLPSEFESKQPRYYRILSPQNIVACDKGYWTLERWSPLLTTDFADVLSAVFNPPMLQEDDSILYGEKMLQQGDIESEQERIRRDHIENLNRGMPNGNPVMLDSIREMLMLCHEKGWNAVLVTPPYPRVYTECFSGEILERFHALNTELSEEFGISWLDYSQDAEFIDNLTYFKNIDHLNLSGAHAFSVCVKRDLSRQEY